LITIHGPTRKYYRPREEIYACLVETARDVPYCSYTDLTYGSKLPYVYARRYINRCVNADLIIKRTTNGNTFYDITPKGKQYLKVWNSIRRYLSLPSAEE
jgi:predicted transcriptional regulator